MKKSDLHLCSLPAGAGASPSVSVVLDLARHGTEPGQHGYPLVLGIVTAGAAASDEDKAHARAWWGSIDGAAVVDLIIAGRRITPQELATYSHVHVVAGQA